MPNMVKNKSIMPKKKPKKYNYKIEMFLVITTIIMLLAIIFIKPKTEPTIITKTIIKYREVEEIKPTYEYLKSVTVRIFGYLPQKTDESGTTRIQQKWSGTGVVIKIDRKKQITYILTNAHVVTEEEDTIIVIEDGDRLVNAQVIKRHKYLDLAVIKIGTLLNNKIEIKGCANSKPQDKIYLAGHHLGKKYLYGEGVFAGYRGYSGIIQAPVLFGNSGSGVFDKYGKLVGIVFAGEVYNDLGSMDVAHGMIVETYNIKMFLRELGLLKE